MKIESSVFENNTTIPTKYSCDGDGINPPLTFKDIPRKAKSLALIVHDPDAPGRDFVHMIQWDINPKTTEIEEDNLSEGTLGENDMGHNKYVPMCPPRGNGIHHYFFELYALDTKLKLKEGTSREDLEKAMEGHILEKAQLVGLYSRG